MRLPGKRWRATSQPAAVPPIADAGADQHHERERVADVARQHRLREMRPRVARVRRPVRGRRSAATGSTPSSASTAAHAVSQRRLPVTRHSVRGHGRHYRHGARRYNRPCRCASSFPTTTVTSPRASSISPPRCAPHAEITVVAPERDRSGASNSLTLDRPLIVRRAPNGFLFVNGTPTDCVHLAVTGLLDELPDMVDLGHQSRRQHGRRHDLLRHRRGGHRRLPPRHSVDRDLARVEDGGALRDRGARRGGARAAPRARAGRRVAAQRQRARHRAAGAARASRSRASAGGTRPRT